MLASVGAFVRDDRGGCRERLTAPLRLGFKRWPRGSRLRARAKVILRSVPAFLRCLFSLPGPRMESPSLLTRGDG